MEKRTFTALFLFLVFVSCSKPADSWITEKQTFTFPPMEVSRVYLPAQTNFFGIEVEILSNPDSRSVFLNLRGRPLLCNIKVIEVGICGTSTLQGTILEGGQKILLTDESAEIFITAIEWIVHRNCLWQL